MRVVLLRHGIAEERTRFAKTGQPDSERPLTVKGAERTRRAVAGLLNLVPDLTIVATSPYQRARQTAELVAAACDPGDVDGPTVVEALRPAGEAAEIGRWLEGCPEEATVALVGHEPDLSGLMAWLTTADSVGFARFKKAGACLIELRSARGPGGGELQWLLTPAILRRIAG